MFSGNRERPAGLGRCGVRSGQKACRQRAHEGTKATGRGLDFILYAVGNL